MDGVAGPAVVPASSVAFVLGSSEDAVQNDTLPDQGELFEITSKG